MHNNHFICAAESKNINTSGHSVHSTATVITTSYHVLGATYLYWQYCRLLLSPSWQQSDLIKRHSLIPVTDLNQSHLLNFIFANNMFQKKMEKVIQTTVN